MEFASPTSPTPISEGNTHDPLYSSVNESDGHAPYRQMISDELMWTLHISISIILGGVMTLFGTVSNVVNLIVFSKLGLKESMDVCLFSLSLTDFLFCFSAMITTVFPIWNMFFSTVTVDPLSIAYLCFDIMVDSLFLCSGWITTYMAIERCVCVIFPFRVRQLFTRNRSIAAVFVIFLVIEGNYFPMYCTAWLRWVQHDVTIVVNGTTALGQIRRLVAVYSNDRATAELYVDVMGGNVLPLTSLFILLASVAWMVYGLQSSSKTRQKMMASPGDGENKEGSSINLKTTRLVKVVLLIAIIFTVCSIPRLYVTYTNLVNPEMNEGGKESNFNTLQWRMVRFAATVNASANVFVYLKINSSFQAKLKQLLKISE